jgi:hypothetical protein
VNAQRPQIGAHPDLIPIDLHAIVPRFCSIA